MKWYNSYLVIKFTLKLTFNCLIPYEIFRVSYKSHMVLEMCAKYQYIGISEEWSQYLIECSYLFKSIY